MKIWRKTMSHANKNKSVNDLRRSPLREALSWGKTM